MINNQKTDFTNEVSFKKVVASETIYGEWDATQNLFVLGNSITEGLWAVDTWFEDSEGEVLDEIKSTAVTYIYDHTTTFMLTRPSNQSGVINPLAGIVRFKDTARKKFTWTTVTNMAFGDKVLLIRFRRIG